MPCRSKRAYSVNDFYSSVGISLIKTPIKHRPGAAYDSVSIENTDLYRLQNWHRLPQPLASDKSNSLPLPSTDLQQHQIAFGFGDIVLFAAGN